MAFPSASVSKNDRDGPALQARAVQARGVEEMISLKPLTRRIVYVLTFELFAIALSTALLVSLAGGDAKGSLPVAVAVSVIAVAWNYTYNLLFEAWERRRKAPGRTVRIRAAHAFGFETGLCLLIIPLYMSWYGVGLWEAMKMEAAILLFFLAYTFLFTWIFDAIVQLPTGHAGAIRPGSGTPAM
ncbi:PACE efflux transporter [Orrella sp. JC864]|uniref:PACE efflux transporter n=1 Tax=Orrella sp. JC864 TaxID=3120298 RepID=UPI00300AF8A6